MTDHIDRFASAAVARMATVSRGGAPHVVPITFAATGDTIHTPIDHKPKTTPKLRRLANIAGDPRVSVLADHYEGDWERLWWVRADGVAAVLVPGSPGHDEAAAGLAAKYDAYADTPITGPIIEITVTRWTSWAAAGG